MMYFNLKCIESDLKCVFLGGKEFCLCQNSLVRFGRKYNIWVNIHVL